MSVPPRFRHGVASLGRITTTEGVSSGTARIVGGLAYRNTAASTAITGTQEAQTDFDSTYSIPANTLAAGTVVERHEHAPTGTTPRHDLGTTAAP